MLTIKAINNNKNSVRVYNHAAKYSKSDLLAYANNVNSALFADIRMKNGYSILTHKIDKNGAKIRHNAPDKKRHKIFVDRCIDEYGGAFETYISDDAITDFETFYFGKYQDYIVKYRGETVSDFIPDHIAWNKSELDTRILELTRDYLTSNENINAADIVYNFDV